MRRAILVTLAAGALTALLAAQATAAQAPRKGGTLKAMFATDVDFIDPSLAYYAHSWEIMGAMGANLLRFADAEGSAGSRLVPEVAAGSRASPRTAAPTRSRSGAGFRFSNGKAGDGARTSRTRSTAPQHAAAVAGRPVHGRHRRRPGRARRQGSVASGVVVTNGGYGAADHASRARRTSSLASRCRSSRRSTPAVGIQPQGAKAPLHSAGPYYVSVVDAEHAAHPQAQPVLQAEQVRDARGEHRLVRVRRQHRASPRRCSASGRARPTTAPRASTRPRTPISQGSTGSTRAATRSARSRSRTSSR